MLILSRRIGQTIVIGDNIVVKLIDINGENIKLGVAAPRNIPIKTHKINIDNDQKVYREQGEEYYKNLYGNDCEF